MRLTSHLLGHVVAFGLGICVVESVRALRRRMQEETEESDDDESDSDVCTEDEEDEDSAEKARKVQITSLAVRDDYSGDETYKMLLICNMELYKLSSKTGEKKSVKMSPGKAAAQCSHATLGAYRRGMRLCPRAVRDWLRIGQMKITVKCPTLEEMLQLEVSCAAAGLNTCVRLPLHPPMCNAGWCTRVVLVHTRRSCRYLIRDAGHTEIEPGSRTVLAVGPAPASAMNPLTRHLKPF